MNTIYLVGGSSGDYEERTEWIVEAWTGEGGAAARVEQLNARVLEFREEMSAYRDKEPSLADFEIAAKWAESWGSWNKKRDRIVKRYRKLAVDANQDEYAAYCVILVELRVGT
jgi:hypothetical protein